MPATSPGIHKALIAVVVAGAVVIAAIGFAGSYAAVRDLAHDKGFGDFANVFPIGIDAGIVVLLALDLLLTWIRIPFPLLRQTAWLLTAATIAFNGAAAWPDPLGVGMHAVIPVLFVVSVEAARHAVGRIADITADRHMESVRIARWLLAPVPTFRLWRRMKLWELRSYDEVIKLEQDRLVYRARLRARYGRAWRRKAPVESLMPLRLARYGVPLRDTAPAGLAAAGLETNAVLPSALPAGTSTGTGATAGAADATRADGDDPAFRETHPTLKADGAGPAAPSAAPAPRLANEDVVLPVGARGRQLDGHSVLNGQGVHVPEQREPEPYPEHEPVGRPLAETPNDIPLDEVFYGDFRHHLDDNGTFPSSFQFGQLRQTGDVTELTNRVRHPTNGDHSPAPPEKPYVPSAPSQEANDAPTGPRPDTAESPKKPAPEQRHSDLPSPTETVADRYYDAWCAYRDKHGEPPKGAQLSRWLYDHGIKGRSNGAVSPSTLRRYIAAFPCFEIWNEHCDLQGKEPTAEQLLTALTERGVKRNNGGTPWTLEDLEPLLPDFHRRRRLRSPIHLPMRTTTTAR
ncbi:DUF2637 domain-containing protein [Streptomyces sp. NA02950]|uniref:DUF2637 domain-containing protein n=1 Tax=Streptomyces sp. NA02950 TaxID=2742137 RepID=UPI0020CB5637|nr:DUF2637 domain-containing protein [Streptomyces sp. NA02950]